MIEKLKIHKEKNQRVKIYRKVAKNTTETSNGYILDFSKELLLLHECYDFKIEGYAIIPIDQIKKVRFNKSDKYFDKMMKLENQAEKAGINYAINLSNWKSLFTSLKQREMMVIAECEDPEIDSFTIGPVKKVGSKYVYIQYFNAEGYFDEFDTSIDYSSITRVAFDTPYINVFSKYTRHRK